MGILTDSRIEEWQNNAGLILPSAEEREKLAQMKGLAIELLECIVLEQSGIRDGAGFWVASDPITGIVDQLNRLTRELQHF